MDNELLRTFLEVYSTRHFGRAAKALNVTQAAVSTRIKSLEQLLDVQLFDRSRREIKLTPEGNRLVPHAERQIAAWRYARQDVAATSRGPQLAIGGSLRLWDILLQQWLHRLRSDSRDMAIIAECQPPETLTRRLIDGVLDIAVVLEPAQLEVLQIVEIGTIEMTMVSTSRGLSVADAFDHQYIYVDWGLSYALEHRRLFPDAFEANTRVDLAKMAVELMLSLDGTAILPLTLVEPMIRDGVFHTVADAPVISRVAYATFPVRSARRELIDYCLDLL
jgi:DNA-binding transcriptional LysR family regulator